jgi:hypothetical protein
MGKSNPTRILVDMDNTLIYSLGEHKKGYKDCNGKIIKYKFEGEWFEIKVSIRPYAIDMISKIKERSFTYILWSAGVKSYVHAVMKYFTKECGIKPLNIYTRDDMVESDFANNGLGSYKSMVSLGYHLNEVLIIDDNPLLIDDKERSKIINISAWEYDTKNDSELLHIIEYLDMYKKHTKYEENYTLV